MLLAELDANRQMSYHRVWEKLPSNCGYVEASKNSTYKSTICKIVNNFKKVCVVESNYYSVAEGGGENFVPPKVHASS